MKVKSSEEIENFCREYAEPLGLKVALVEFKQGKNPTLTVYIDKEGGVDLDACEKFHRAIFDPIDEFDPTFGMPYTLNVSSLGADRPFVSYEDFILHIGKMVEVRTKTAVRGKKYFDGVLTAYDGKSMAIKNGKDAYSFELKNVAKVNEYIDFE